MRRREDVVFLPGKEMLLGPAAPGASDSVEVFWRMTPGLEQPGWREHTRVSHSRFWS